MQLRWALWEMAIGSSKEDGEARSPSKKASRGVDRKKKVKDKAESSRKGGGGGSSRRRSLFRKSSKAEEEAGEEVEEEESEEEQEAGEEEEEEEQSLRWAADALLPRLRALESSLLDRAVSGLWSRALDAVKAEKATAVKEQQHHHHHHRRASSTSGGAGSQQERQVSSAEEAACRWVDVLRSAARDAASSARASVPEPHAALFVARALGALLDRVDGLLCAAATGVEEEEKNNNNEERRRSSHDGGGGGSSKDKTTPLTLPASFLPFDPLYPLTFTSGVGIKLAVGTIGLWAADAGVVPSSSSSIPFPSSSTCAPESGADDETACKTGGGNVRRQLQPPRLFPRLRAVADLLMMPKEALVDASVRLDVLPHLSLRSICGALSRFKPDDHAPDPLPPGLLDVLREQAEDEEEEEEGSELGNGEEEEEEGGGEGGEREPGPAALLRALLAPVPERAMLARGLVPVPLSLEQSPETEDELDELEEAVGGGGGGFAGLRFDLLRDLWSSAR